MNLFTIVWKNLQRRVVRTALTVVGIAVGIAAVVALTGFARGLEASWAGIYEARDTDVVVRKVTSRSVVAANFEQDIFDDITDLPEVESTAGLLTDMMGVEEVSTIFVFGWEYPSFLWDHLTIIEGRMPSGNDSREALLGELAAETLGKGVGDPLQIEFDDFEVVGIYRTSALVETGAIVLPLEAMQTATERPGLVNLLNVRLHDPANDGPTVKASLEASHPTFTALEATEVASSNSGIEVAKAMSFATSLIAIVVGAFGVANTMLMSVFERTREIGILLAVGWNRRRVMAMILLESLMLALLGGAVGTAIGIGAARLMETTEVMRGRLQAEVGPDLFLTAFLVAVGLGTAAGLYPAWRAARLRPTVALSAE
ncbi:MAG: FtsX-like permease family protein [Pseudomonadota bacterium]